MACTDPVELEGPTAPNQLSGDDKADGGPLWAGLTSVTLERWVADPCNDGRRELGDAPVIYDTWARQRAAIRNICFEVWKPGVTDTDNPDYWRLLDVQVHFRHGSSGPFEMAYVNSIDRRGNNRRYAWALEIQHDPTAYVASLPQMTAPFRILSESGDWAFVESDLEFYFTVNGRKLETPSGNRFVIRYQEYLRTPKLPHSETGYVLHDIVTCEQGAVRFGSGAGFFAADIRSPAAVAALGAGADGSLIYGSPVASNGTLLSMTYGTQVAVPGEALPGFVDAGGLRIEPQGSTMRVELDVYDRALAVTRQLSATLTGCAGQTAGPSR
ncbi:MAG TPA: hypothetical protein VIU61_10540 [Kofleriaceae bacterium]